MKRLLAPLILSLTSAAQADVPTFNRDVAPILTHHCNGCHRPGQNAPFALTTFALASDHADMVAHSVESRYMPPWKPASSYGEFRDSQALSASDIDLLSRWAKGGTPEGPPPTPSAPVYSDSWTLGPPDQTLTMSDSFQVPAGADDMYQCFVIPVGAAADHAIDALEFRPGSPHVVRDVIFYLDTTGAARALDAAYPGLGYLSRGGPGVATATLLDVWAPGTVARSLPGGLHLPANADLIMQIHYHPGPKPDADRSTLGLHFAKSSAPELYALAIRQRNVTLPAGSKKGRTRASFTTPTAVELVSITAHMHLLGKTIRAWARLPDGSEKHLLSIADWDVNWLGNYRFREPISVPAGTKIELEASFDNSTDNPRNPDNPAKLIKWSENDSLDMAGIYLRYLSARPGDTALHH